MNLKETIVTATSRDILVFFYPEHDLHSMDGASYVSGSLVFHCSCKTDLPVDKEMSADRGIPLKEVKARLDHDKLGQIGRPR